MTIHGAAVGLVIAVAFATPAMAQGTNGPRVTAAFGVGRVNPLPLELAYTAPSWSVAVQVAAAKHLIIEGVAGGWHHTTTDSSNEEIRNRAGQLLLARQATASTREGKTTVSLNALATAALGRVRLTSGAGVGLGAFTSRTTETVTLCAGTLPDACDGFNEQFRLGLFSMQCVLGVDVSVTSRLQAFVGYRLSQPFSYALGEISVQTGLRIGLK